MPAKAGIHDFSGKFTKMLDAIRRQFLDSSREKQLHFLASTVSAFTIFARFHYDTPEFSTIFRNINEAIHRLSGQLRDPLNPATALTESRADTVMSELKILPESELARISEYNFAINTSTLH